MAHTPILGYKEQLPSTIDEVNTFKIHEEELLRQLDEMRNHSKYDQRWLSIAFTDFQTAFMALNRAILRPDRIKLPKDEVGAEEE